MAFLTFDNVKVSGLSVCVPKDVVETSSSYKWGRENTLLKPQV